MELNSTVSQSKPNAQPNQQLPSQPNANPPASSSTSNSSEMTGGGGGIAFNSQMTPSSNAINMHGSGSQVGGANMQRFPGHVNATGSGSAPPQPVGISTSAHPTPTLPAVSSTPAHPNSVGLSSSAPTNALQVNMPARPLSSAGGMTYTSASTVSHSAPSVGGISATPGAAMNSLYSPGGGGHPASQYGQPMMEAMPPSQSMPGGTVMHPGMQVGQQGMMSGGLNPGVPGHSTMVHHHPGMGMRFAPHQPGMGMVNHHPGMAGGPPGHMARIGMTSHQPVAASMTSAQMMRMMGGRMIYGHAPPQPGPMGGGMAGRMMANQQMMGPAGQPMMQPQMGMQVQQSIPNQSMRPPSMGSGGGIPQDHLLSSLEPSLRTTTSFLGTQLPGHQQQALPPQAQSQSQPQSQQPMTSQPQQNDLGTAAFGSPAPPPPPPQTSSVNPSPAPPVGGPTPPSTQLSGNTQVSSMPPQQRQQQPSIQAQGAGAGVATSLPGVVSCYNHKLSVHVHVG